MMASKTMDFGQQSSRTPERWETGKPTVATVECLERISKPQCREGKLRQSPANFMSEEKELRVWGDPGSYSTQEGTEEWGAAWRENPGNLPSFKQSDDPRMCVRKLLRAGERATQTDEGKST